MDLLTTYIHHSELQVITTPSLIPTFHKSLHANSYPAYNVFNSRFLVMDANSGDSSASRIQVFPSRFQYRTAYQPSAELPVPVLFFIIPRRGPRRQQPVSPVACVTVVGGMCLPTRCLETALL
jgi:hypothetical protein